MDTASKAKLINEYTYAYMHDKEAEDFFAYNDIGIPLAIAIVNDLCVVTDKGADLIKETYDNLCAELDCSNVVEYESLYDMHENRMESYKPINPE